MENVIVIDQCIVRAMVEAEEAGAGAGLQPRRDDADRGEIGHIAGAAGVARLLALGP